MSSRSIDTTEIAAGALFIVFGLFFGAQSLGMEIGTAFRMGPGYFPLVLSGILILFGLAIAARAAAVTAAEGSGGFAWRGVLFILPAPVFFGLTVRGLGFIPAVFLTTLIAGLASFRMKPRHALVLAVAVTAFCTLVFSYALGLPFRRIGPWLTF